MKKNLMNKKGLEYSLPAWIIGIVIITFIMFIYIFAVLFIWGDKGMSEDKKIDIIGSSQGDLFLTGSFFGFLEGEVMMDGANVQVKDLILSEPDLEKEKFKKFVELGNEFMDKKVMKEKKPIDVPKGYVKRAWLRIYDINEEFNQYSSTKDYVNKYGDYEIYRGTSQAHTYPCAPEDSESILIYAVNKNKKIALCMEYEDE